MKSIIILFIVTSSAMMGTNEESTGVWLEELTTPYYALTDAGYDVEIVTVSGGDVPIDKRSLVGDEHPESVKRYFDDEQLQKDLKDTESVEGIDTSKYAAVFFPGGHGTMFDYPDNPKLAKIVTDTINADKPVAAVCHGPAVFVGVMDENGEPLVKGRKISAFTNSEEDAVGLSDAMPFLLESKLSELGAEIVKGDDFAPQVVVDGNLITGQNPPSSKGVAEKLIEKLQRKK